MTFVTRIAGLGALLGALALASCPNAARRAARAEPEVTLPLVKRPKPAARPLPEPHPIAVAPSAAGSIPAQRAHRLDSRGFAVDPKHALGALAAVTFVYERPDWKSTKLGYLRVGDIVQRADQPAGHSGCRRGWYRIRPEGYVCAGKVATLDVENPVVRVAHHPADRDAPLPYLYGLSRYPTPPLYVKIPTVAEERAQEPVLGAASHLWADVPVDPLPDFLHDGARLPAPAGVARPPGEVTDGRALQKSGFAFLKFFEVRGRKFGLSTDLELIPLDRVQPVTPSRFHGLLLDERTTLPVVFVMRHGAHLYEGDPRVGLTVARAVGYREALPITGKTERVGKQQFVQTTRGQWLDDDHLVHVDPMRKQPGWATRGRGWIDVSILKQTLVAYRGTEPVYVTLVSTGVDGLGDPKTTHSTVRGVFLIHTKHISVTMSGDDVGDEFNLSDVPYVQYFTQGYALHAAYWHDAFGKPHSHGCVNLSPIDAKWLFNWTDPPVPRGWHGALSLHSGTLVSIHP